MNQNLAADVRPALGALSDRVPDSQGDCQRPLVQPQLYRERRDAADAHGEAAAEVVESSVSPCAV